MTVCGLLLFAGGTVASARPAEKTLMGQVSSLDAAHRTLVVKRHSSKTTFELAPQATVMQGAHALSLSELKVGEHVTVHYTEEGSKRIAQQIKLARAAHHHGG